MNKTLDRFFNISVVIPTYNREFHLLNCLNSVLNQIKSPLEVIIIDNSKHDKAKDIFDSIKAKFNIKNIDIFYYKNIENSGATARNLGAYKAKGDLVGFLDDDVILDKYYYYEIEKVFLKNKQALGVQGFDNKTLNFKERLRLNHFYYFIYNFEKLFQTSSFYEKNLSRVLPSLCVTNPYPDFTSTIQSEWISTCAGVFLRKVFDKYRFEKQFKKYSWNEYIDFSYSIFLENSKSLFITPKAHYNDVQTQMGRLQPKELIYMSEVYDLYIFLRKFDMTFKNIFIYVWSKIGRVIYNIVKIIFKQPRKIYIILHCLYAPVYVLINFKKIKKGNLEFFNKTLL